MERYDVLIEGTNLEHAILAAALAQAGLKVIHIDQNEYYGDTDACIPTSLEKHEHSVAYERSDGPAIALLSHKRDYNIELNPRLLYAASDIVQTLRDVSVNDYVDFKPLNAFYLFKDGVLTRVPGSKEDIFTDKEMPLIKKRRLMNFLKSCLPSVDGTAERQLTEQESRQSISQYLSDAFRLDEDISAGIVFPLGQAFDADEPVGRILPVIKLHLQSLGIFGAFPVIVPMYGGASELSQAFCRKAAVKGCTHVLGQGVDGAIQAGKTIQLQGGHRLRVDHVVAKSTVPQPESVDLVRRTLLVSGDFSALMNAGDAACIAFVQNRAAVQCQVYGSGTGMCPPGQSLIYLAIGAGKPHHEAFTQAQAMLRSQYEFEVILQLDYKLPKVTACQPYDAILASAKQAFQRLTPESSQFLSPETDSMENEAL